jgi:virginiamycin B lyase
MPFASFAGWGAEARPWTANAIVRFDPATEKFESFPSNRENANVRQMLARKGETWIAESGTERIRVIRHPVRAN